MGLKKFIGVLLPFQYREPVLGDLEERGFRMADIASVLPRVWCSHARRSFVGASLAGASEEVIERRTRQFESRHRSWALFALGYLAIRTFVGVPNWTARWALLLLLAVLLVVSIFYGPAKQTGLSIIQRHRQILMDYQGRAKFGFPYVLAVFAGAWAAHDFTGRWEPVVRYAGCVLCFAYGRFRARCLQKEIDSLP
jgi:hypothetical protein